MAQQAGWMNVPGVGSTYGTLGNEYRWGKGELIEFSPAILAAATRDSTSTPTTVLRSGLVLGVIAASGKYTNYAATATDGSQVAAAILPETVNILDWAATAVDKWLPVQVSGGVRPSALFGFDETARGHLGTRFQFDDRNYGTPGVSRTVAKATSYTVLAADNGTTFETTGAVGAVTFTLPAVGAGYRFTFVNTVNQNMVISAPAGKLIGLNGAAFTTLTFSTASAKIGASATIVSDSTGAFYLATNVVNTATYA